MSLDTPATAACQHVCPHAESACMGSVRHDRVLNVEQQNLLLEQLPTVRMLARGISQRLPPWVDVEDLESAGIMGLIDAVVRFDPEQKVPFNLYARFRIHGAMLDSLRAMDWGPRELRRRGREVEDVIRLLATRLHRMPDETEVATQMGIGLQDYQRLVADLHRLEIGSLHVAPYEGADEDRMDSLPARPEDDPLFLCLRSELKSDLSQIIAALPERERLLITLSYFEEMSPREISLVLGVKPSRISQLHKSAVRHLKSALSDRPFGRGFRTSRRVDAVGRAQSNSIPRPADNPHPLAQWV